MSNEEYAHTQTTLLSLSAMISELSLDAFLERINEAHAVAPILDPTIYRRGAGRMEAIAEVARRAIALRTAFKVCRALVADETDGGVTA